ncbi:MAG: dephospho-CoA kinase [Rhodospirillales bacterium]|jgi:dephospho-CoA kinase|nr:dephospho-CoA kinase [Rhodospirillales bacterium]MDP6773521.1 dephospho-CoA kinase [Rhodospirillales bacterium]
MVILGLTGSIGMGKSTAAQAFRRAGVPVHDADRAVHGLLAKGGRAVALVEAAFPGVTRDGAVDREKLGQRVFADADALARLEAILHPMVREAERRFLRRTAADGHRVAVLDVPLLFETGGEERCDAVVVVSAPPFVQRARVMKRSGMTRARLAAILAQQMPDKVKCRRADFVVQTGIGRAFSLQRINNIVRVANRLHGCRWPPSGRRRCLRPRPRRA